MKRCGGYDGEIDPMETSEQVPGTDNESHQGVRTREPLVNKNTEGSVWALYTEVPPDPTFYVRVNNRFANCGTGIEGKEIAEKIAMSLVDEVQYSSRVARDWPED